MVPAEELHQAQVNRSIRAIKAELEFLCDSSVISPATLSDLLSRIPAQTALHAPISVGAVPPTSQNNALASEMNGLNLQNANSRTSAQSTPQLNEKQNDYYGQPSPSAQPQQAPPPPSYTSPPPQASWPPLAQATALYAYSSSDAGDLELHAGDPVAVTEYMNAEWWKGRNTRTGAEGIFPRSYVKVEEKASPQQQQYGNNYGNAPLQVSQMGNGEGHVPSKMEQQGKKFGKKLGNAAIFGAGATLGSQIVNGIL